VPSFPPFAAWPPQAYGIYGLLFLVAAWMFKSWLETRKLSTEDRMARREGYARQVETLQRENRDLGGDLRDLRHEYDDYRKMCRAETDELRHQIVELQNEVTGLSRRLDSQAVALARELRNGSGK
jgi:predicted  nucleic acid-binding Zn-ribbon protein